MNFMADLALPRRPLGRTGLMVSPLGLAGSYGIDADSVERAFHELAINYFFVMPRMKGLAEGLRKLIRAGLRDRLIIASGTNMPLGVLIPRRWEKTVRALDADYIDVFQVFYVGSRWMVGGRTWPAMLKLKDEKKVRALGISSHNRPLARALADELNLDMLMIRYNAAHRGAEEEIFASLGPDRPGIIAYTATRWGKLLRPINGMSPMTGPECYRFCLSHPAVDVVLSGAQTFDQLSENVRGVLAGPLTPPRLDELRRFGDAVRASSRSWFR